jgi:hydrogenase maturation protease
MSCRVAEILVLGYGNELRGDDAAGPRAVAMIEGLNLPGVRTLVVQQLTPDLSEALSQARAVVFVDASLAQPGEETVVSAIEPSAGSPLRPHVSDPRDLLALARTLYGRCPPALLVAIPARAFEFGAPLSPVTARGVTAAVAQVRDLANRL